MLNGVVACCGAAGAPPLPAPASSPAGKGAVRSQLTDPSAARSSRISGAVSFIPVTRTVPPNSAAASMLRSSASARSIGPALDQRAFCSVTGPVRTPICGQIVGRRPPSIVTARPVSFSICAAASRPTVSVGTRNRAATASSASKRRDPATRANQRIDHPMICCERLRLAARRNKGRRHAGAPSRRQTPIRRTAVTTDRAPRLLTEAGHAASGG